MFRAYLCANEYILIHTEDKYGFIHETGLHDYYEIELINIPIQTRWYNTSICKLSDGTIFLGNVDSPHYLIASSEEEFKQLISIDLL